MTATIIPRVPDHLELEPSLDTISPWQSSTKASAQAPVLPLRQHITSLIAEQAGCSHWRAGCLLRLFGRRARGRSGTLTRWEKWVAHQVLDQIIPDYTRATAGSIHEALDRRYLPQGKTFEHGKTPTGACHMVMVDNLTITQRQER